jgi:hypothetical protein
MVRHWRDPGLSEHDRDVLQKRQDHGWFVTTIAEDETGPSFAYSFGLYEEFKHPELIVFGIHPAIMHQLINNAGELIKSGNRYRDGDVVPGLLEGFTCALRSVNPQRYLETCAWAVWFYEHASFPVLQMFWPDKGGRFPWDAGFTESLRGRQPDLSQPRASS